MYVLDLRAVWNFFDDNVQNNFEIRILTGRKQLLCVIISIYKRSIHTRICIMQPNVHQVVSEAAHKNGHLEALSFFKLVTKPFMIFIWFWSPLSSATGVVSRTLGLQQKNDFSSLTHLSGLLIFVHRDWDIRMACSRSAKSFSCLDFTWLGIGKSEGASSPLLSGGRALPNLLLPVKNTSKILLIVKIKLLKGWWSWYEIQNYNSTFTPGNMCSTTGWCSFLILVM